MQKSPKPLNFLVSLAALAMLSACAVATAGVTRGDERNLARSVNDVSAHRVIRARMKRADNFEFKGVDVEVAQGVVLLSGHVQRPEDKMEAERIAWSAQNIDQVGNEIKVSAGQKHIRNLKDGLLEKSIRARLTADKYVKARNINVEIHDGVAYLLGVARNQPELERIAQIAGTTKGTRQVVSYMRVAGISSKLSRITQPPRALPEFLSPTPPQGATPMAGAQYNPQNLPQVPPSQAAQSGIEEIRSGAANVGLPVTGADPYYIDPVTGSQIPVRYNGKIGQ